MAHPAHLNILKQGVHQWNLWRQENPKIQLDLEGMKMVHGSPSGILLMNIRFYFLFIDLSGANLSNPAEPEPNRHSGWCRPPG